MTRLKKTLLVCTCTLLLAVPVWFSAGFLVKQLQIRLTMKQQLTTQELKTVKVHRAQVTWIEPGKEVLVKGCLFDVYSITEKADTLWLKGLYDTEEDNLNDKLERLVRQKTHQGLLSLFSRTLDMVFIYPNATSCQAFTLSLPSGFGGRHLFLLPELALPLHSPPPEVC